MSGVCCGMYRGSKEDNLGCLFLMEECRNFKGDPARDCDRNILDW